jgi:nickel-dependent lactate racemase
MSIIGNGSADQLLSDDQIARIVDQAIASWDCGGQRVLVLVPDLTRSCPVPLMFRLLYERLGHTTSALDFMVALGTHQPLDEEQMCKLFGITADERDHQYNRSRFLNHAWNDPSHLCEVGRFTKSDIAKLTSGLFELDVTVTCNRAVRDYDHLLIVGPVFPHEVAGFSGGNKYIFPGISGPEVLNFFHWLGAVITNPRIIGNKWTPVRRVIDRSADMLPLERKAFCLVVKGHDPAGLYFGSPEDAWSAASDLSRQLHTVYKDRPFHTVLSCAPKMYDELWVGAKCMYKLEPVVADGGRLIIYAPHIHDIAAAHDRVIREIGYHTCAYFLNQWDRFKDYPWGVVAHSTHVRGIGSYEDGVEKPRIDVVLATGIPEEVCHEINLGYMDPAGIDPAAYAHREEEGVLLVPNAGEVLYRLKDAPPELGGEDEG